MQRFPERIRSNEVSHVAVAQEIHRMTVDEYVRIVRDFGWESTELVEGVVYDVTPEYSRHAGTAAAVFRQVDAALDDDDDDVLFSGSVRLDAFSLVEPDVYVVDRGVAIDPEDAVPVAAVKLVVEVSVTTQAHDRGPKLVAYAKAGVPEVWLIDPRPEVGELVRYRDPEGASYATVDRFDVGENARGLDVGEILGH
jgi:Uma2 family endonuclease